jgi:hypothetical protein
MARHELIETATKSYFMAFRDRTWHSRRKEGDTLHGLESASTCNKLLIPIQFDYILQSRGSGD